MNYANVCGNCALPILGTRSVCTCEPAPKCRECGQNLRDHGKLSEQGPWICPDPHHPLPTPITSLKLSTSELRSFLMGYAQGLGLRIMDSKKTTTIEIKVDEFKLLLKLVLEFCARYPE